MSLKKEIEKLLINNYTEEAIEKFQGYLKDTGREEEEKQLFILATDYQRIKQKERLNMLSYGEVRTAKNQVISSIFDILENSFSYSINYKHMPQDHLETTLLKIIKTHRRRRHIVTEAEGLLSGYQVYKNKKSTNPTYDLRGRALLEIKNKVDVFVRKVIDQMENRQENFTDQVNKLIEEDVPSYKNLKKAYELCQGRGMVDEYIERNLKTRPDIDDTRIDIAYKIEDFLGKL